MNKTENTHVRLVILAGPNGSGKSSYFEKRNKLFPKIFVNPDVIAKEINSEDVWSVRIAAGRKAIEQREEYLSKKESFCIESTLSGNSEINFIKKAIQNGFKVTLIFVAVDNVNYNVFRVSQRVLNGGHDVPYQDIARRRERSLNNFLKIFPLVPRILVIDNTKKIKTILRKNNNKITFISKVLPKWFTYLFSNELLEQYRIESTKNKNISSTKDTYFIVPLGMKYKEGKALGAQWDSTIKYWYVPSGNDLTTFYEKGWKILPDEEVNKLKSQKAILEETKKETKKTIIVDESRGRGR